MIDWLATLRERVAAGREVVLVTVAQTRGSAPREAGTRMLVGHDDVVGTIGGGHLEFEAIRIARDAIATNQQRGNWLVRFPLAARLGQCCGGVATLLFQPVTPDDAWIADVSDCVLAHGATTLVTPVATAPQTPFVYPQRRHDDERLPAAVHLAARSMEASTIAALSLVTETDCTYVVERIVHNDFRVMLFGSGHVGRALVQVLGTLPCRVTWVDQREHAFPAVVPDNVTIVASEAPGDEVRHAQADTIFLVMTHSHGIDFEVTRAILARNDFRYFGLIGSAAKRTQFERRLLARGVAPERLQRMTCPIGIGGIRSKQPGAIAIAVAAQLLQLRESAAMTASRRATAA